VLIVRLVYKDRSPGVSFHVLQSLWYQVAWMVILAVGWTIRGFLLVIIVGFLLVPLMVVLSVVPLAHMGYAAYKVNKGVDYRSPITTDTVAGKRSSESL
jgi:uncharacterized protein